MDRSTLLRFRRGVKVLFWMFFWGGKGWKRKGRRKGLLAFMGFCPWSSDFCNMFWFLDS